MRNLILAVMLGCVASGAVAAPNCDASVVRAYTLDMIDAGATCHSFVSRFGPSRWGTEECIEMGRYAVKVKREMAVIKAAGCTSWTNGPSRENLAYATWLHKELVRLQASQWDEQRGWVTK